jgi:tRNA threonylcarbamoyladenosine biosynthesis protein TsaB
MQALIIDTSTERGLVALFQKGALSYAAQLPFGLQNAQFLLIELERLFKATSVNVRHLDLIAIGAGPGSYTGMRVGAVAAKMLSFAGAVPLVGVCSLSGFAPEEEGEYAVLIDAKISGVYLQTGSHRQTKHQLGLPQVCPLVDAIAQLKPDCMLLTPHVAPLSRKFAALAPERPWRWIEAAPDPKRLYSLALEQYSRGHYSTDGALELLYMRGWKGNHVY